MMRICIGKDSYGWDEKFAKALDEYIARGLDIKYEVVDLDKSDWIESLKPFDSVIWNPSYMGLKSAGHYKEKIFFIEHYLNKKVMPSYQTVWAFESKIAESYFFKNFNVPTPETIATFSFKDAIDQLSKAKMPIVVKESEGAAGKGVRLVSDKKKYYNELLLDFAEKKWAEERLKLNPKSIIIKNITRKWLWYYILKRFKILRSGRGAAYWQRFLPDNPGDLRIVVVGNFATGFWRQNRKNDFRASGSGKINFDRELPEEIVLYLIRFTNQMGYDSMVYDVMFEKNDFLITEMSYNCPDKNTYKKNFVYRLIDGNLQKQEGHFWIEELWVKAFVEKYYEHTLLIAHDDRK